MTESLHIWLIMQLLKSPDKLYGAAFKLLNVLGPMAGISIIIGSAVISYLETRPQQLAITYTLTHNKQTFYLEVAKTPEELEKGLKFRSYLPSDRGMLFVLGKEYKNVDFWMYKVNFPLDIIYLDKNNVVTTVVDNAAPCAKYPCSLYTGTVATQVLELPANAASIKVGEKLLFQNTAKSTR